jgi:hypothetical protein
VDATLSSSVHSAGKPPERDLIRRQSRLLYTASPILEHVHRPRFGQFKPRPLVLDGDPATTDEHPLGTVHFIECLRLLIERAAHTPARAVSKRRRPWTH